VLGALLLIVGLSSERDIARQPSGDCLHREQQLELSSRCSS
jgi:hypothetical protein